jgi:hypothetical protein
MDEVGAAGVSKTTDDRAVGTGTGRQSRCRRTGFKFKERAKEAAGAGVLRPLEMSLETFIV